VIFKCTLFYRGMIILVLWCVQFCGIYEGGDLLFLDDDFLKAARNIILSQ
jgi:hypothetical protein